MSIRSEDSSLQNFVSHFGEQQQKNLLPKRRTKQSKGGEDSGSEEEPSKCEITEAMLKGEDMQISKYPKPKKLH